MSVGAGDQLGLMAAWAEMAFFIFPEFLNALSFYCLYGIQIKFNYNSNSNNSNMCIKQKE
jgi:hypothetical protein